MQELRHPSNDFYLQLLLREENSLYCIMRMVKI